MRRTIRLLIEAFAIAAASVPARLVILGQGELEARLRQQIADRGLERRGLAARLSAEPLEVHRSRRRVRAHLALRRIRQRADRSDGAAACRWWPPRPPARATSSITASTVCWLTRIRLKAVAAALLPHSRTPSRRARRWRAQRRLSAERFAAPTVIARYDAVLEQLAS